MFNQIRRIYVLEHFIAVSNITPKVEMTFNQRGCTRKSVESDWWLQNITRLCYPMLHTAHNKKVAARLII